jgi:hypothetical protein
MKSLKGKMAMAACVVSFAAFFSLSAFSQYAAETTVKSVDSVSVDGETINFTYTVDSKCPARAHDSSIEIDTENDQNFIDTFSVRVVDAAYESECKEKFGEVTVSGSANLAAAIADKTEELQKKGCKLAAEAKVVFPRKGCEIAADTKIILPPIRTMALEYARHRDNDKKEHSGPKRNTLPVMVDVTEISYTPMWRCMLYKNDGARKDGFEGNGATIEEARRDASTGCKTTHNPKCDTYSKSPDHTTCDVQLQETTKVTQYDSNKLPPNAALDSWSCTLNKNDGARKDGFTGTGKTEDDARSDAANKCSTTNNPKCDFFSTDDNHTSCSPKMAVYGPKPTAVWKCTLWKNDGARKDGFTGTGSTEKEARQNTIPGCKRTNNPKCLAYSNDPDHTQCQVDFVYP